MPQVTSPPKQRNDSKAASNLLPVLVVTYQMWGRKSGEPPFTAIHNGEKVGFKSTAEVKTYVKANGYSDYRITT